MGKRFKTRPKKQVIFFFKIIIYAFLILFLLTKLLSFKIFENNSNLIKYVLEESNHLIETDLTFADRILEVSTLLLDINVKNPDSLLSDSYIYKEKEVLTKTDIFDKIIEHVFLSKDNFVKEVKEDVTEDVSKEEIVKKKVYIYNTHQIESYADKYFTVKEASYYLKQKLEENNIDVFVEEGNMAEYLASHGLNYDDSYIASRSFLEQRLADNFDIYIDLHRDALTHAEGTVNYEGKDYAKLMFLIGKDFNGYEKNYAFTSELNNILLNKYSFLTKGILEKTGPYVNGIYNQDLSEKVIVVEVGGNNNLKEEVYNSLDILSLVIAEKLGG
jgi:stage II sporulation protein P